jgi:TonB family protein
MPARGVSLFVVCTGVCFAGAQLSRAQEATSANLPDQFQTGEMIQIQKPKKKKGESNSKKVATAVKEDTPPVPEQMPTVDEVPTPIAPAEEKKLEPHPNTVSMPLTQKAATPTEPAPSTEEPAVVAVPRERKIRPRKRSRPAPAVHSEPASISAPVAMSLSVARSMASTAPLPEYTYEMKRRNLSGSGTCVVTVDMATGTVTDATMSQSTGSPLLDKLTIQTFKGWRFKPGSVSQVRIPISYE